MGWWSSGSSGPRSDPDEPRHHPSEKSKKEEKAQSFLPPPTSSSTSTDWNSSLNAFDWSQFTEPKNLVPTIILTCGILFSVNIHRRYLRRFPEATDITSSHFRRRSILGHVTSVGDGDNFRIYHTPGGRLVGWGWLPWMKVPTSRKELKDRTIHIRLAGIDAPELAHFGRPAQPFAHEAHMWLTSYLQNQRVRAYVHRPDQYKRVIATVYVRRYWLDFPPLKRRDVSYEMLKHGLATVYEAKTGVEFGDAANEAKYRAAEKKAKARRRGMWKDYWRHGGADFESPREYKTRMAQEQPVDESYLKELSSSPKRRRGFFSWLVRRNFSSSTRKTSK